MDTYGCLYACTDDRHNKYYFIADDQEVVGCDCYYGRIETLARGNFSNQYRYHMVARDKENEKVRKWKRKGENYVLIFQDNGPFEYLKERAVAWARTGGRTSMAPRPKEFYEPEPEPVGEAMSGWFNNAK